LTGKRTSAKTEKTSTSQKKSKTWGGIAAAVVVLAALMALFAYTAWTGTTASADSFPASLTHGSAVGLNVLVITLDTTRADRLGCYGYDKVETPSLDSLATNGIRYGDAVTPVPITLPAHASIFTGLYPPNHGARNNGAFEVDAEQLTLAELLKGAGYDTAAFVSAFVLDARFGLSQGFDVYDDEVDPAKSMSESYPVHERQATSVTDGAVAWLRARGGTGPFFMWVHYFDPHQPYRAPEPFATRYAGNRYDAEVAYMDSQVGRLLKTVEELGLGDNTLIFAVGDHGEGLGDHDEETHGLLMYEPTIRVPLILSCPGIFRGSYVIDDVIVSITDLFPTIVDLLDIPDAPASDGTSLLAARKRGDRMVYMETLMGYLDKGWAPLFGVRRLHDKYILAPRPEYYDLRSDPGELNNLYVNPPARVLKTRDVLLAELDSMLARWPSMEEVERAALPADPETIARLESLGYVQDGSPHSGSEEMDPKDMMAVLKKTQEATELTHRGLYDQALQAIKEAVAATPQDPSVHVRMARTYLAMQREPEAEEALRKAIAIRPGPQALVLLAQILIKDKRFEEADQLLQQAVILDPKHGAAFIAHGDFARAHGRLHEARMSYMYAMQVDPYRSEVAVKSRLEVLDKLEALRQQQQQQP